MQTDTERKWEAFLGLANPHGLHPEDSGRLHTFIATAYVNGELERLDLDELHGGMKAKHFADHVEGDVITLVENATGLFEAHDRARR